MQPAGGSQPGQIPILTEDPQQDVVSTMVPVPMQTTFGYGELDQMPGVVITNQTFVPLNMPAFAHNDMPAVFPSAYQSHATTQNPNDLNVSPEEFCEMCGHTQNASHAQSNETCYQEDPHIIREAIGETSGNPVQQPTNDNQAQLGYEQNMPHAQDYMEGVSQEPHQSNWEEYANPGHYQGYDNPMVEYEPVDNWQGQYQDEQ